jgi:hypothetical protein
MKIKPKKVTSSKDISQEELIEIKKHRDNQREKSQQEWLKKPLEEREQLWNLQKPKPFFEWVEVVSQETFKYQFNEKASAAFETLRDYLKYPFLNGRGLVPHLIYSQEEMFCIDPFNLNPPQIIKDREEQFLQINEGVLDVGEFRRRNLLRLHYAEDFLISMKKHSSFKEPQTVALIVYIYYHPETKAEDLRNLEVQRSIHPEMRYQGKTLDNVISKINKEYVKVKKPYIKKSSIKKEGEILYTLETTINEKGEEVFYVFDNQEKLWTDLDTMTYFNIDPYPNPDYESD